MMDVFFSSKSFNKLLSAFIGGVFVLSSSAYAADLNRDRFMQQIQTLRDQKPSWSEVSEAVPEAADLKKLWPQWIKVPYEITETFTNNVFGSPEKDNDWITDLKPAINVTRKNQLGQFFASAGLNTGIYAKNKNQNYLDPSVSVRADLFQKSRIKMNIRDSFAQSTNIGSSPSEKPTKSWENSFGTGLDYEINPKLSLSTDYTQSLSLYSGTSDQGDSFDPMITTTLNWSVTPKITLSPSYAFGIIDYTKKEAMINSSGQSDSRSHSPSLGVRWQIAPKSRLSVGVGYSYWMYHAEDQKNYGTYTFSGGYDYVWTPKTTFRLFASRGISENVNRATGNEDASGIEGKNNSAYTTNTVFGLNISYALSKKISASFSGSYATQQYGAGSSNNTTYIDLSASLAYHFSRFLSFVAGYSFGMQLESQDKSSNFNTQSAFLGARGIFE